MDVSINDHFQYPACTALLALPRPLACPARSPIPVFPRVPAVLPVRPTSMALPSIASVRPTRPSLLPAWLPGPIDYCGIGYTAWCGVSDSLGELMDALGNIIQLRPRSPAFLAASLGLYIHNYLHIYIYVYVWTWNHYKPFAKKSSVPQVCFSSDNIKFRDLFDTYFVNLGVFPQYWVNMSMPSREERHQPRSAFRVEGHLAPRPP
jgi:hypothetical protein